MDRALVPASDFINQGVSRLMRGAPYLALGGLFFFSPLTTRSLKALIVTLDDPLIRLAFVWAGHTGHLGEATRA